MSMKRALLLNAVYASLAAQGCATWRRDPQVHTFAARKRLKVNAASVLSEEP